LFNVVCKSGRGVHESDKDLENDAKHIGYE
jgi:hypothetical protein